MHTQRLQPRDTAEAAEILRRGGLLGIPTETVYGLGANGLNPDAVGRIFAAKGRPQDNPLILHIPSADWLERYCGDIPDTAYALAERFWPGPLTMVLRRKRVVPDVVTAALPADSVALSRVIGDSGYGLVAEDATSTLTVSPILAVSV